MLKFNEFVDERIRIWHKKNAGEPRPWTNDPVLHSTRFTNIDRNDDKGTIALFNKVKGLDIDRTVQITVLYRICYSSLLLLDKLEGVDEADLKAFNIPVITNRMPYNVWLEGGNTMQHYLKTVGLYVAHKTQEKIKGWSNKSILSTGRSIGTMFGEVSYRRMFFIGTEVAKDLSVLYPNIIDPSSKCMLGPGAVKGLKLIKGKGYDLSNFTPSVLEHALCEYSKYCSRWGKTPTGRQIYTPSQA